MESGLDIQNVSVARAGVPVVSGCSFSVGAGELVLLTGPNGAGKSSLLFAIMGHPSCEVREGDIMLDGESMLSLKTYERARRGLFLSHQEPPVIAGVTIAGMIRARSEAMQTGLTVPALYERIRAACQRLQIDEAFVRRMLGADLSGGEKKRAELLQLVVLPPKVALLDEIDAGLDAVGRERLLEAIAELRSNRTAVVLVTHSPDLADRVGPNRMLSLE